MTNPSDYSERYMEILRQLNMTQEGAAMFLKIGPRTSRRYASGEYVPRPIRMLLELMIKTNTDPLELLKAVGLTKQQVDFHEKHMFRKRS